MTMFSGFGGFSVPSIFEKNRNEYSILCGKDKSYFEKCWKSDHGQWNLPDENEKGHCVFYNEPEVFVSREVPLILRDTYSVEQYRIETARGILRDCRFNTKTIRYVSTNANFINRNTYTSLPINMRIKAKETTFYNDHYARLDIPQNLSTNSFTGFGGFSSF